MKKSESIKHLGAALCKFQASMNKVIKDSNNPFFKSKYASLSNILSAIQGPLADSGLAFSQFPAKESKLTTILIHAESGEYIMESYTMRPVKGDPQGIGSAITYQRRYALGAILGINVDEDDDANAASTPTKQPLENKKPEQTKVAPTPKSTPAPAPKVETKPAKDLSDETYEKFKAYIVDADTASKAKTSLLAFTISENKQKVLNELIAKFDGTPVAVKA